MLMKLCYFVTVFTLGGIVLSIAGGRSVQECLAQAFLGFSVALLLRRTHEIKTAKQRAESPSDTSL
jgi:hypothetical protein